MIPIRVALRGSGILREFNEAGVLSAADVHVAERLGRLGGETRDLVLFAAALAVRAVRSGSVCLDLTRMREIGVDADDEHQEQVDLAELPWPDELTVIDALRDSPLVCGGPAGPLRPLRVTDPARPGTGPLLYLDRYYRQEQTIRRVLTARGADHPPADPAVVCRELDRLFGPRGNTPDRQRLAAALAATHWTTVVAGGPGTGKTHTIARILALLSAHGAAGAGPGAAPLRTALAAPTGKAAARLQEAVRDQAGPLGLPELSASTLHRLLGWQRGRTTRFRYHEHNRLPYDVVVVDETSMVSLTMMSRLLTALRPDTRLVLAGDPDQLASVDAGAVLADLVAAPFPGAANPAFEEVLASGAGFGGQLDAAAPAETAESEALTDPERNRLRGGIVRLTRGRRFGGRIADLAVAVRAGDTETALDLLRSGGDMLELLGPDEIAAVRADVVSTAQRVTAAASAGDAAGALAAFESHRLLCAHRRGPYGVEHWDRTAAEWAAAAGAGPESRAGTWYPGQPLLVTANDHEARIYNGDTGVVLRRPDGSLRVALQRGEEPLLVHPTQFPAVVTVFAMTIHRSQGSQYDAVTIVLPEPGSSLLTRELLYTAITRARRHVRILGSEEAIRTAIDRHVLRASGLSLDHADRPG
ncbi:exodeoxyribonuclease V subunit alpha [Nocardia sp. NPDC051750]|uniref:exodeoxyribonuclease V subunit alpha n=1 Tax=Nocardia sp. NPDC051750 TaxID=3364325 RepID=UPI00378842EF